MADASYVSETTLDVGVEVGASAALLVRHHLDHHFKGHVQDSWQDCLRGEALAACEQASIPSHVTGHPGLLAVSSFGVITPSTALIRGAT